MNFLPQMDVSTAECAARGRRREKHKLCVVDEEELAALTARAERLGFEIFCDHACGYVLRRIGHETTNPATHPHADLEDLREMVDGIERGCQLGRPQAAPPAMT